MTRFPWLVAALSLTLADSPAVAGQGDAPRYRQISTRESKFQQELNAAAADGYRVIAGNAATEFALLERVADGTKRSYVFASAVELFLERKKLEPGYRLVRPLFAADEFWSSAVFERVGDDNQRYEYKVLKAGSPKDLRKKIAQQRDSAFGLVALSVGKDAVAIYEAGAPSSDSTLIFGNGGEIQKQFASGTSYCVIDADGTKEPVYAVRPCAAAEATSGYEWLATTKTETLERELNAAVARGLGLVPSSLIGIAKTTPLIGSAYNYETVCLVARIVDAPASRSYRVIGTKRAGTFAKEMAAAADDGFTLAGFAVGYQEIVAVMQK